MTEYVHEAQNMKCTESMHISTHIWILIKSKYKVYNSILLYQY